MATCPVCTLSFSDSDMMYSESGALLCTTCALTQNVESMAQAAQDSERRNRPFALIVGAGMVLLAVGGAIFYAGWWSNAPVEGRAAGRAGGIVWSVLGLVGLFGLAFLRQGLGLSSFVFSPFRNAPAKSARSQSVADIAQGETDTHRPYFDRTGLSTPSAPASEAAEFCALPQHSGTQSTDMESTLAATSVDERGVGRFSANRDKLTAAVLFLLVLALPALVNDWLALLALFLSGAFCIRAGLADRGAVIEKMALTNAHPMLSYHDRVGRSDLTWVAIGVALIGAAVTLAWEFRHTFPF